jgi:hypothetical protein
VEAQTREFASIAIPPSQKCESIHDVILVGPQAPLRTAIVTSAGDDPPARAVCSARARR